MIKFVDRKPEKRFIYLGVKKEHNAESLDFEIKSVGGVLNDIITSQMGSVYIKLKNEHIIDTVPVPFTEDGSSILFSLPLDEKYTTCNKLFLQIEMQGLNVKWETQVIEASLSDTLDMEEVVSLYPRVLQDLEDRVSILESTTIDQTQTNSTTNIPSTKLLTQSTFTRVYRTYADLSLDNTATAEQIVAKMENHSVALLAVLSTDTIYPSGFGFSGICEVTIKKASSTTFQATMKTPNGTTAESFYGVVRDSDTSNNWSGWKRILSSENISTIMPISSAVASNEKVLSEKVVYDEFANLNALGKEIHSKVTKELSINLHAKQPLGGNWSVKTWTGLTSFRGNSVWTDGTNIYYSYDTNQYVLDVATSTWSVKTWKRLTSFIGSYIWTDGTNIYYSYSTSQYVLDVATSTWSVKNWNGLTIFDGRYVWTDGTNIYYSYDTNQYVLDVATSTWSVKTWKRLTSFIGSYIWTDGTNIYYSYSTSQYVLDVATSTWSVKTWNGLTIFDGRYVWTDGTNIYYSSSTSHRVLIPKKSIVGNFQ